MANKTAQIRVRTDPDLKRAAEKILAQLGLTPSAAITLFYKQIVQHRALPLTLALPPATAGASAAAPATGSPSAAEFDPAFSAEMDAVIERLDELMKMKYE